MYSILTSLSYNLYQNELHNILAHAYISIILGYVILGYHTKLC